MKLIITGNNLSVEEIMDYREAQMAREWLRKKACRQQRAANGRFTREFERYFVLAKPMCD